MTARGLASGLARGLARGIARGSSGGAAFSPLNLSGLLQYFLDGSPSYEWSESLSSPVLRAINGENPASVNVPCVTLDGSNDQIYAAVNSVIGARPRTFCGWFYFDTGSLAMQLLAAGNEGTGTAFFVYRDSFNSNRLAANFGGGAGLTVGTTTLANLTWYHLAATYDGDKLRVYVNGVLEGTGPSYAASTTGTDLYIGTLKLAGGSFIFPLDGAASDVHYFSDTKTAAELLAIMQGTRDRTNIEAHWLCQDGPGVGNTNTTVRDTSGNARNLTLQNGNVATMWGRTTTKATCWSILYGGRMSSGVFIPGNISGSNCVDGEPKVGLPGRRSNALTTINTNPSSTEALTAINSEASHSSGSARESIAPANTKFCNNSDGGDYRFFSVSGELTGDDLTNAQAYAGISFILATNSGEQITTEGQEVGIKA